MTKYTKILLVILIITGLFALSYFFNRHLLIRKAKYILKQEIGEDYKDYYVDSIKKDDERVEVHFKYKDIHVLGGDLFVVINKDGSHKIFGGE